MGSGTLGSEPVVSKMCGLKRGASEIAAPSPRHPDNFFSREFLTRHVADIIKFYESRAIDETGGFFQSFYIDGEIFDPAFRQIVSSTRMVINFMMSGILLKRPDLIKKGEHGLDYLEKVHYVEGKNAYAFTVRDHKPEDMTQQAYAYAFILAAHAAALKANAANSSRASLEKVWQILEERFWVPEARAYLDTISAEGVVDNSYRGQNSNMHMCEGLIAAYEATRDSKFLDRAKMLAETFTVKLAGKADGFVWEHYTADFEIDWEYNKDDPTNIYRPWGFQPGHQAEWAKNLMNIYRHLGKAEQTEAGWMIEKARQLFDGAWELSWDAEHGGLVYGFGPDRKWCDSEKYFWVQGESLATLAQLYQASQNPEYIEKYVALWSYCWKHWVDHVHGGWIGFKLTRDNQQLNKVKAQAGAKCDYHTLCACIEALRAFPETEAKEGNHASKRPRT